MVRLEQLNRGQNRYQCVATMTVPTHTLNATFSPRLEPYPAFRLHLDEINTWLQAGHSVRSVWMAWKRNGAFPGSYRSVLRMARSSWNEGNELLGKVGKRAAHRRAQMPAFLGHRCFDRKRDFQRAIFDVLYKHIRIDFGQ